MTNPAPRRRRPAPASRGAGRRSAFRAGVSLLELVAVTALLAVFAGVAASRSDGLFGDAAARTECERLAGLLHDARRRAILDGRTHCVRFDGSGGTVVAYALERETAPNVWEAVGPTRPVPAGVTMTCGADRLPVDFEGVPVGGGASVDFVGPHQSWNLFRPPHTGSLRISKL